MPRTPKEDNPKKLSLVPKSAPAKAAKKRVTKKRAPKPVKDDAALQGPRPLSQFDLEFCHLYVQTNKQVEAFRQLRPEAADPHKAAHRMMQRPEIREHIKAIFLAIDRKRKEAAEISARANLLSLEVADDRLFEILQQPRKTRAEMLSRDLRTMLVHAPGYKPSPYLPNPPKDATAEEKEAYEAAALEKEAEDGAKNDALLAHLEAPAPVEDADLLKAIKLTYDRKQGIIKADKTPAPTHTTVMLYKPKWFGQPRQVPAAPVVEAAHG